MEMHRPSGAFANLAGDLRLWRLEGMARPDLRRTLRLAEAARAATMRRAEARTGSPLLPSCLHGPSRAKAPHRHAYWLPHDLDGDGRLDHLAVHVPGGLCAEGAELLDGIVEIRLDGHGRLDLVPIPEGPTWAAVMGPARLWLSAVPFFGALHDTRGSGPQRPGLDVASQLLRELGRLGRCLPAVEIAELSGAASGSEGFLHGKRTRLRRPSQPVSGWFALAFAHPVAGPLAVGFGAHFGLGRFRPPLPNREGGGETRKILTRPENTAL